MASSPFLRVQPTDAPQISLRALQRPVGTSFLVHGGIASTAWAVGVLTDRVDTKDMAWAAAPVVNAWYQAVGIPVLSHGLPLAVALRGLSWRQGLLLGGVTIWGVRLLTEVSSRASTRGHDDVRYTKEKLTPSFWPRALATLYAPEALFQTLIALPLTVPLRATRVVLTGWGWTDMAAVGTFTAGLALEVLADGQKAEAKRQGVRGLYKDGVWSVVRHPNYLGDALVHTAFALLALNTPGAHPALFLGPLANYVFLRFVSGDAQVEAAQEERYNQFDPAKERQLHAYRKEKNAFWPAPAEFTNPWTLAIIAAGAAGVGLERVLRAVVKPSLL